MYFKYVAVLYFSYLDTCSIRLLLLLLILPLLELTHHFVLQSDVLLGVFQGCMLRGTAGGSNAWSISLGCLCCRYHVCSGFGTRTPSTRNIPADISDHAPCTGSVLAISTVNIILRVLATDKSFEYSKYTRSMKYTGSICAWLSFVGVFHLTSQPCHMLRAIVPVIRTVQRRIDAVSSG